MIRSKERRPPESVNAGSMADIAFLLLIFFLISTTIKSQKGLMLPLPKEDSQADVPINERNLFKIRINSNDQLLVENEVRNNTIGLQQEIKSFILNEGKQPHLSDNPKDAIISLKTNRGTSYRSFIKVLDEIKGAYYDIYGERVGLSSTAYRNLDRSDPLQYELYLQGKDGIPMNISIAEPDQM